MKPVQAEKFFSELPIPHDYYSGKGLPPFPTPQNILLFYRGGVFDPFFLNSAYSQSHHRYVAIFNFADDLQVLVDESIIRIGGHECLLILPHQYHRFINDYQRHLSLAFVTFTLADTVYFENISNTAFGFGEEVEASLETVIRDYRSGRECSLPYRAALLLLQSFKNGEGEGGGGVFETLCSRARSHDLVIQIVRAVRSERSADIGRLSEMLGYSESYIRRRFKLKMGIPLGRFIVEMRMARAKKLLLESDYSVSRIADSCGCGSLYSFSRSFRNHCGLSPSEYRRTARSNPRTGESKRFAEASASLR